MAQSQHQTDVLFTGSFKLDRAHFEECYDQSNSSQSKHRIRIPHALGFLACGLIILFFTTLSGYIGAFFIILALLEGLSGYYHRSWWIIRQMLSRRANTEVTIGIQEAGITIDTDYGQTMINWSEITSFKETDEGFLLHFDSGANNYLSKSTFSEEGIRHIQNQLDKLEKSN